MAGENATPMRIGITGQAGFVGTHLYNYLGILPDSVFRVPFADEYFLDEGALRVFVRQCDVIVHLAAVNRCPSDDDLYATNLQLVDQLIAAMTAEQVRPHVLFTSSSQETRDNAYGRSKREGRERLERWALANGARFTGLVVPNVFGPFGRPFYNSFVATFAHQLTHGETPVIQQDAAIPLIDVISLCRFIVGRIEAGGGGQRIEVPSDCTRRVSEVLHLFQHYAEGYLKAGVVPDLSDHNDLNLFNAFRSFIPLEHHFPVQLTPHADARGSFVETIRLESGGQVSFSTTQPGVTRGNHFHIRKVERFTVLKGRARIELRRIGTNKTYRFIVDGDQPAYADMPVWYTHNIKNVGEELLYTQFWINEWYDPADPDTFAENV